MFVQCFVDYCYIIKDMINFVGKDHGSSNWFMGVGKTLKLNIKSINQMYLQLCSFIVQIKKNSTSLIS